MSDRRPDGGLARTSGKGGWKHPRSQCPGCGKAINATSDPHGRGRPRSGDLTLATCCGTILQFDNLLRLHTVTLDEINALPASTQAELKEQQDRWRIYQGNRKVISLPPPKPRPS